MEQLTPILENASYDSFFRFSQHDKPISDAERLSVLEHLMGTLELQAFGHALLSQLSARVQINGVAISGPSGTALWGTDATYRKRISIKGLNDAAVSYYFTKVPDALENKLLDELHQLLEPLAKNVLEHEKIRCLASKDSLTGLGNRAAFNDVLARQFSLSRRTGATFGLLMIDMDKFKAINDQFGHQEGDKVLVAMAQAIGASLRDTDFAFRFGGDEFCCIIEDADTVALRRIGQRIRRTMLDHAILSRHQMRCSIGSSLYTSGDEAASLFERADRQLYQDKHSHHPLNRTA